MEKGDAQWAYRQFREACLPAFLSDLRSLEARGFENPASCPRVGRCLNEVADVLQAIPNVRPPAPTAAAEFREFALLYQEWNNRDGTSPEIRQERARAHESLAERRKKFGRRIGLSIRRLEGEFDWETMEAVFEKFNELVNDNSVKGVFTNLKRALEKFSRKSQKYRV